MASTATVELPDTASGVLALAREQRAAADLAEAKLLQAAVQWAVIHPAESVHEAETYTPRSGLEGVVPVAGPGAPLVAEFSVAEFAAALSLGTEAGKRYLGQAVELRYRLPKLWRRVVDGDLPAWKARRVAEQTIAQSLSVEAAGFVDRHVAPVAHRIRPAQLDRLVDEAIARFMPDEAEQRRRDGADRRRFDIDTRQVTYDGTAYVAGELDLADALDLDDAIRSIASQLKDLGCEETLDVRRSLAAGELARRQLALDLTPDAGGFEVVPEERAERASRRARSARTSTSGGGAEDAGAEVEVRGAPATSLETPAPLGRPTRKPVRKTVLHLHLAADAVTGSAGGVGRCENTRSPVTADQIRDWCGHPDTHLTIKPVIDLADHVHTDAYEVPDRITERVALRDHHCVFPFCTQPARRLRPDDHGCDCDHTTPWRNDGSGGKTCTCQLAPLCRHHHRLKTHGGWTYTTLEPSTYLWTSPLRMSYLRDHTGTTDVNHDRRR